MVASSHHFAFVRHMWLQLVFLLCIYDIVVVCLHLFLFVMIKSCFKVCGHYLGIGFYLTPIFE